MVAPDERTTALNFQVAICVHKFDPCKEGSKNLIMDQEFSDHGIS